MSVKQGSKLSWLIQLVEKEGMSLMKRSVMVSYCVVAVLTAIFGMSAATVAQADTPGPHPHYLHALSDLRYARGWLTALGQNNVMGREMDAEVNIDKAIADIKSASIDDGKDLKDHPPIDVTVKHKARLVKALDLLRGVRKDLRVDEDDKKALGWRKKALEHVGLAIDATKQAIKDAINDAGA
jgi:hypothetical protein